MPKSGVIFLWGPQNKDYSILESILQFPYLWNLPNEAQLHDWLASSQALIRQNLVKVVEEQDVSQVFGMFTSKVEIMGPQYGPLTLGSLYTYSTPYMYP